MSTETSLALAAGGDARPELLVAARGLQAAFRARGLEARLCDPWSIPAGVPLVVLGSRDEPALMAARLQLVFGERYRIDLLADGHPIESFPFFGPSLAVPPDRRRILIRGGESSRRIRTTAPVLEILRRDGARILCWEPSADLERARLVDEVFTGLTADEIVALFGSAAAVLEVTDDPADLTIAPCLAAGCGVPVVVHAGAALEGASVVAVTDASPEAFAAATRRAIEGPRRAADGAAVVASRILEVLGS